jgi:hypothetical protein
MEIKFLEGESRELQRQVRGIEPCLPRAAKTPPAGPGWIHEIKHDRFRILAERESAAKEALRIAAKVAKPPDLLRGPLPKSEA